jgi:hypothetical protein
MEVFIIQLNIRKECGFLNIYSMRVELIQTNEQKANLSNGDRKLGKERNGFQFFKNATQRAKKGRKVEQKKEHSSIITPSVPRSPQMPGITPHQEKLPV